MLTWPAAFSFKNGATLSTDQRAIPQILKYSRKALKLDANNVLAYVQLGTLAGIMGNLQEARRIIDEAIKIAPNSHYVYHASAQNYATAGQRQKEVIDRKKARDLDPLFWLYQANFAGGLISNGELEKAEQEVQKGKLLFPEAMGQFVSYEGSVLFHKKEYKNALRVMERYIAENPSKSGDLHLGRLGFCYAKNGNKQKAKEWIEKIPTDNKANLYWHRAIIYSGLRKADSVFHNLNRAVGQAISDRSQTYDASKYNLLRRNLTEAWYFQDLKNDERYEGLLTKLKEAE